ncbi:S-methyl-5'-thioadenosine phosphorylase [Glycomyces algeriensis]|uniref:Purine nucleoside phosphorylase n=1 Tax=Glycomyces algeriensis TaxID=256037 RepID=A0A9W6G4T2_9ACTN|nr:S-methyl-5'-thioadenosine phosphorylase [Glycomyces algeriensis]MDA1366942.1 S-methyl-5'-thioadenosine phosphorylase [Glycomyces algeriensis]MDR7352672.1 5'-methylthioadenosine phosphorylase [Glycomyces algeriensis]GLI40353.1 purine nucleoside phosphorylase [Glycomyces algeriensis]
MNEYPPRADIGVFGGSGFYSLAAEADTIELQTEWGPPSAPVAVAAIGGARVAFLPRHGTGHRYPPHRVNYRANVDAMRQLGVRALVSPFAAGSLRPEIRPGEFVVCDQLVDRTWGRESTFHDEFSDGPVHLPFAEPYDPRLRRIMLDAAAEVGAVAHDGGTVVVVNGPRFSTRAESRWHRDCGWHVVNMTQAPEAPLAMEAGIPFVGIALVTDYDAGLDEDPGVAPVSQEAVFAVFQANLHKVRELLDAAIPRLAR